MKKFILLTIFCLILPLAVLAMEVTTPPDTEFIRTKVRILNSESFQEGNDFYPFAEDSKAEGLNLALADLNNDGYQEIIIANGKYDKPLIKIYNYKGEFQSEFLAYDENFINGFKVTTADLYNDGNIEILTAPNDGTSAQIKIFDSKGNNLFSFLAFGEKYKGGASVAAGDINNDKQKEIIVGAGSEMGPKIRIFNTKSKLLKEFYAYEKSFQDGVNVLTADLNNDKSEEIITAPSQNHSPEVRIFNAKGSLQTKFYAYNSGFGGGVNLASADIDNDKKPEIITAPNFNGGAHVRFFTAAGINKLEPRFFVWPGYKGGLSIASGDINKDGQMEIIAAMQNISQPHSQQYKSIDIDLTKQMLYAMYKGVPEKTFIISTGKNKYPTPKGTYKIQTKLLKTNMARNYGPDNPDNYNLKDVPNVMYFYKDFAIHGAYWHWRFGTRVSHGCVNLKLKDATWLYNWSEVGLPVNIYASKK